MSRVLFYSGWLMLFYDFSGHFAVTVARLLAYAGYYGGASLWNCCSTYIYPRILDEFRYDLFWSTWHSASLLLMIIGFFMKGRR